MRCLRIGIPRIQTGAILVTLRRNLNPPPRPTPRKSVMPFKVQVGPHQVSIHHGQTVLVAEPDGQINSPSEKGLYFFDTRVISNWTIYANGAPWELLNG